MKSHVWSGQFVVIGWPFTDRSNSKCRSPPVLQEPDTKGDLHVPKVTSRSTSELAVAVTPVELAEGQLKTTSFLRPGQSLKILDLLEPGEVALPSTLTFWATSGKLDAASRQE